MVVPDQDVVTDEAEAERHEDQTRPVKVPSPRQGACADTCSGTCFAASPQAHQRYCLVALLWRATQSQSKGGHPQLFCTKPLSAMCCHLLPFVFAHSKQQPIAGCYAALLLHALHQFFHLTCAAALPGSHRRHCPFSPSSSLGLFIRPVLPLCWPSRHVDLIPIHHLVAPVSIAIITNTTSKARLHRDRHELQQSTTSAKCSIPRSQRAVRPRRRDLVVASDPRAAIASSSNQRLSANACLSPSKLLSTPMCSQKWSRPPRSIRSRPWTLDMKPLQKIFITLRVKN